MDEALKAALAKHASLQQKRAQTINVINDANARLHRIDEEAAELERWIELWHRFAGIPLAPTAAERIQNTADEDRPKRPRNPDRETVARAASEIIQERGMPVSRRELFEALRSRGVEIHGKDPEMVLSTMLWRSKDKIVRLPSFGYWLKSLPYVEARYDPLFDEIFPVTANEPEDGIEVETEEDGSE